jgi:hypothetical protein
MNAALGTIAYSTTSGVYTWIPANTRAYTFVFAGGSTGATSGSLVNTNKPLTITFTCYAATPYYFIIGHSSTTGGGGGTFMFQTSTYTIANCLFACGGSGLRPSDNAGVPWGVGTANGSSTFVSGGGGNSAINGNVGMNTGGGLGLSWMCTNGFSATSAYGGGIIYNSASTGSGGSGGGYSGGNGGTNSTIYPGGGGSYPAAATLTSEASTYSSGFIRIVS